LGTLLFRSLVSSSCCFYRHLHSFPTRRSSDLQGVLPYFGVPLRASAGGATARVPSVRLRTVRRGGRGGGRGDHLPCRCVLKKAGDRKSTRLNSSHVSISYAVFCLKKKSHFADA